MHPVEFIARYLRLVLPTGMRAIRRYGFCHPAAKVKRERVAFLTGRWLFIGPVEAPLPKPGHSCRCCGGPMKLVLRILPSWKSGRGPPADHLRAA